MRQVDFIRALTAVTGQRKEAEKVLKKLISEMRSAVRKGDKIILTGFGSFYPKIRKAQKRRHPKTGKMIVLPPKRVVKFIPSNNLFK